MLISMLYPILKEKSCVTVVFVRVSNDERDVDVHFVRIGRVKII